LFSRVDLSWNNKFLKGVRERVRSKSQYNQTTSIDDELPLWHTFYSEAEFWKLELSIDTVPIDHEKLGGNEAL